MRQCKEPGCLTVFTSREAIISVIENSEDGHILMTLASRINPLSAGSRQMLPKLIQAG